MGTSVSSTELDRIEHVGRILCGIAVFLFVYGTLLLPTMNKKRIGGFVGKVIVFASFGPLIIWGAYVGQERLVESIVKNSDPEWRKQAVHLRVVQSSLLEDRAELSGIELSREDLGTPEGKSFIALLPFYGSGLSRTDILSSENIDALLRQRVREEMGTRNEFLDEVRPKIGDLENAYNEYADASERYYESLAPGMADKRAQEKWEEYVRRLESETGRKPNNVPRRAESHVREKVQGMGVPVSNSWKPYDRNGFISAFKRNYDSVVKNRFDSEVRRRVGGSVNPGLSWDEFIREPAVVSYMRSRSDIIKQYGFPDKLTNEGFLQQYYEPVKRKKMEEYGSLLRAEAEFFADGKKYAQEGRKALYAVVVPPLALFFSVTGALLHVVKTANFAFRLVRIHTLIRWAVWICVLGGTLAFVNTQSLPNKVTESELFETLDKSLASKYGRTTASAMKWTVEFQPYFYPRNKAIESRLNLIRH
ncbi:hypothetical protein [Desulfonatronospira thiodismutans]|nr:hypothetical protein [Desulfonatronospira thiodismutans]